jgi:ATP-dependent DNA ligase
LHPAASRVKKLSAETPTSFVAFDILALGTDDIREHALSQRIEILNSVLDAKRPLLAREPATAPGTQLFLTPCTDDAGIAEEWFVDLEKVGCDGVIAKDTTLPYAEGKRVMLKIKHKRMADCVVGGYRVHKHGGVGSLLLGLYDGGTLRYVGHTSSFKATERKELEAMLSEYVTDDMAFGWPSDDEAEGFDWDFGPGGGGSRWDQGKDKSWISLRPELVCEVSFDFMQSGYRFRHAATFRAWRDDKRPEDCTFDQVKDV